MQIIIFQCVLLTQEPGILIVEDHCNLFSSAVSKVNYALFALEGSIKRVPKRPLKFFGKLSIYFSFLGFLFCWFCLSELSWCSFCILTPVRTMIDTLINKIRKLVSCCHFSQLSIKLAGYMLGYLRQASIHMNIILSIPLPQSSNLQHVEMLSLTCDKIIRLRSQFEENLSNNLHEHA